VLRKDINIAFEVIVLGVNRSLTAHVLLHLRQSPMSVLYFVHHFMCPQTLGFAISAMGIVGGELQQDKNPHKVHQSAKRDSTIKTTKTTHAK
jgi:hypothetical protein